MCSDPAPIREGLFRNAVRFLFVLSWLVSVFNSDRRRETDERTVGIWSKRQTPNGVLEVNRVIPCVIHNWCKMIATLDDKRQA